FSDLGIAFVLSIVLVFAVLASQFESFTQPLVIIGSIPFALIGVVWGLYLTGHTFSVVAFIGVIMLVGIVVNNAILLIDFINQARRRGMPRDEAVVQSGRIRMRPIRSEERRVGKECKSRESANDDEENEYEAHTL